MNEREGHRLGRGEIRVTQGALFVTFVGDRHNEGSGIIRADGGVPVREPADVFARLAYAGSRSS